jgi:succinate dehydrogenase / fumarate reductase iron-sulfur subunit
VGLRVVARGKFPTHFDASEGTAEVRSLIAAVKAEEKAEEKVGK